MIGRSEMPVQPGSSDRGLSMREAPISAHAERMQHAFEVVQRRLAEIKTDRMHESIERGLDTYEMNGRSYEIHTLADGIMAETTEGFNDIAHLRDVIDVSSDEYQKSAARTLFEMARLNYERAKVSLKFIDGGEALLEESGIATDLINLGMNRLEKARTARSNRTIH